MNSMFYKNGKQNTTAEKIPTIFRLYFCSVRLVSYVLTIRRGLVKYRVLVI
jgi:hypothetical protein